LSLRERGTSEILQGGYRQRAYSLNYRRDTIIEDHKVIDKIIAHLKLIFMAERPPPSQVVQQELMMAAEERGEYL